MHVINNHDMCRFRTNSGVFEAFAAKSKEKIVDHFYEASLF